MSTPPTPRDQPFQGGNIGYADIVRDPLHGSAYIRLRDRHKPIEPERGWRVKGPRLEHCKTCGTSWPCEPGQALRIIDALLGWLASPRVSERLG
jgi:hypothetical protein